MARKQGQRGFDFPLAFGVAKKSARTVTSPYRAEYAPCQLCRGRAAIGSEGKRPAHFDGGKRRARARSARMGKLASSIARDIASPAVKTGNGTHPESPCRWLSLHTFLSPSKERVWPYWDCKSCFHRRSRRVSLHRQKACALLAHQRAFLGANNRRGSHCRALRLLFACIPPAPFRKETNFPANGQPFPHTRAAHPHFPIKTGPLSFSESGPCSFSFVSPSARRGRLSRQRRRPTRPQRRCTRRPAWCSAEIHK